MGLLSWAFGSKKEDIPEMEAIELKPIIEIPEKTRRELYEDAVLEVQTRRVEVLILSELVRKAQNDPIVEDTMAALEYLDGETVLELGDPRLEFIKEHFPKTHTYPITGCYDIEQTLKIELPRVTLEDLAKALAKDFMKG